MQKSVQDQLDRLVETLHCRAPAHPAADGNIDAQKAVALSRRFAKLCSTLAAIVEAQRDENAALARRVAELETRLGGARLGDPRGDEYTGPPPDRRSSPDADTQPRGAPATPATSAVAADVGAAGGPPSTPQRAPVPTGGAAEGIPSTPRRGPVPTVGAAEGTPSPRRRAPVPTGGVGDRTPSPRRRAPVPTFGAAEGPPSPPRRAPLSDGGPLRCRSGSDDVRAATEVVARDRQTLKRLHASYAPRGRSAPPLVAAAGIAAFSRDFGIAEMLPLAAVRSAASAAGGAAGLGLDAFLDFLARLALRIPHASAGAPPAERAADFLRTLDLSKGKERLYRRHGATFAPFRVWD
ncbi:hypothetical protein M885DRAFT_505679 [Pelagophyceae sp. CCMP2097]|nr:hypothetical protein M885DRAFT_505679 [Pelagophyceae sp. CCMP2097]